MKNRKKFRKKKPQFNQEPKDERPYGFHHDSEASRRIDEAIQDEADDEAGHLGSWE